MYLIVVGPPKYVLGPIVICDAYYIVENWTCLSYYMDPFNGFGNGGHVNYVRKFMSLPFGGEGRS